MTIYEAQQRLIFQLFEIYDNREAANIADLVMEHITGWKKIDRILNKQVPLLNDKITLLEKFTTELLVHKPVQYVLNEAWFYGLKFFVNEHVLIPRPETEELVEWIVREVGDTRYEVQNKNQDPENRHEHHTLRIFDVGTGSGCIPITLKKNLHSADIYTCDISKEALGVAQRNALEHQADIGLLHIDFLDISQWEHLPFFDIVVSNPPYIPLKDKETMRPNVIDYEPHLALFVENNDPLIFYRSIADFAKEKLRPGGIIFAELHEGLATGVQEVFAEKGFDNMEIKKDMQGKDRMIKVNR